MKTAQDKLFLSSQLMYWNTFSMENTLFERSPHLFCVDAFFPFSCVWVGSCQHRRVILRPCLNITHTQWLNFRCEGTHSVTKQFFPRCSDLFVFKKLASFSLQVISHVQNQNTVIARRDASSLAWSMSLLWCIFQGFFSKQLGLLVALELGIFWLFSVKNISGKTKIKIVSDKFVLPAVFHSAWQIWARRASRPAFSWATESAVKRDSRVFCTVAFGFCCRAKMRLLSFPDSHIWILCTTFFPKTKTYKPCKKTLSLSERQTDVVDWCFLDQAWWVGHLKQTSHPMHWKSCPTFCWGDHE